MLSLRAALLAGFLLLPAAALAQPVATADAGDTLDIIVTAQKRDERVRDVPVTVSAVTGELLERIGVTQLNELSAFVPGLNIQEQSANNPGFVIRGITSDSGSAQEAARVTVYYLGVDVSRSRGSYFDLFDIERVEVVKGPQATLFGTAAAIGAVSVIPAGVQPGMSARITGAFGNYNQRRVDGFANLAGDLAGVRVAFAVKKRDGVVENIAGTTPNGGRTQRDLNGQDQYGARVSLALTPEGPLRADLVYTWDAQRSPGTAFKSGTLRPFGGDTSPFTPAELGGSPQSAAVLGEEELGLWRDVHDINFTARFAPDDSPWATTHIFGYRQFDSLEVFDADGSAAWFLEFAEDAKGWQMSAENRLSYTADRFRGFAGFTWFQESGTQSVPFSTEEGTYLQCAGRVIAGLPCVDANGRVTASQATRLLTQGAATVLPYRSLFRNGGEITSSSVFADATWLPTARLEVTAGARMLWEVRRSTYFADQPPSAISRAPLLPVVGTGGQIFTARGTNKAFLPRFNALARLSDQVNLYATVSKGRRSPIVQLNARNTAAGPVPNRRDVPAETVWNYEAGVKGGFQSFSFGAALFLQNYDNFQVTVLENGQTVTRNAGSARNIGAEAEARWRPVDVLTLFGNVGWIDAKIRDRPENGIFANNRFRLQPEWQFAAGADLRLAVGAGTELFLTPTVTHRSQLFFELPNRPTIAERPVTLANLRGGVSLGDGRFQLTGFATNLFDKAYIIDAGNTGGAFGTATFIRGNPRLYGIEGTVRF